MSASIRVGTVVDVVCRSGLHAVRLLIGCGRGG